MSAERKVNIHLGSVVPGWDVLHGAVVTRTFLTIFGELATVRLDPPLDKETLASMPTEVRQILTAREELVLHRDLLQEVGL